MKLVLNRQGGWPLAVGITKCVSNWMKHMDGTDSRWSLRWPNKKLEQVLNSVSAHAVLGRELYAI